MSEVPGEKHPAGSQVERVTVNLGKRSSAALELAMQLTGSSKTDCINRAVQVYAYLEHVIAGGGSVYTRESEESEPERLRFF